jgi:hypothetical protein
MLHRRTFAAVARRSIAFVVVALLPMLTAAQTPRAGAVPDRVRLHSEGAVGAERAEAAPTQAPGTQDLRSPLCEGRVLFIQSRTAYLNASLLEEKLMARPEFARLGLSITRDVREADLYIEVERSIFTTKFTYSVLDPGTRRLLSTGQVNSLFGTASGKIAKNVLTTLRAARASQRDAHPSTIRDNAPHR